MDQIQAAKGGEPVRKNEGKKLHKVSISHFFSSPLFLELKNPFYRGLLSLSPQRLDRQGLNKSGLVGKNWTNLYILPPDLVSLKQTHKKSQKSQAQFLIRDRKTRGMFLIFYT